MSICRYLYDFWAHVIDPQLYLVMSVAKQPSAVVTARKLINCISS